MKRRDSFAYLAGAGLVAASIPARAGGVKLITPVVPGLKSFEQHEAEAKERWLQRMMPVRLGIRCPVEDCDGELVNPKPHKILTAVPPRQVAECPVCGWFGTVAV